MNDKLLQFDFNINTASTEKISRFVLYSQTTEFKDTAFCSAVCGELAYILTRSGIYKCIFDSDCDGLPVGAFLVKDKNSEYRFLAYRPEKNEKIEEHTALFDSIINSEQDIPLTVIENEPTDLSENEKKLLEAEFYNTAECVLRGNPAFSDEFKNEWKAIFDGKNISDNINTIYNNAISALDYRKKSDIVNLSRSNVDITAMKMCEDGSGDVVIRVKEISGETETHAFIKTKIFDAAFWFDIRGYETKTFRINKNGFVRETYITEGIK